MNSDAMIHWIIIIVDRGKGNKVSQFFQKEQIPVMLMIFSRRFLAVRVQETEG